MPGSSKIIIVTAPSGAGKTTIVRHLLSRFKNLDFSVSATTRDKRPHERHGEDYYFYTEEEFWNKVKQEAFVEWEEVYPGKYYGTLRGEIERIWNLGKIVIFDVDVKGALNLKENYPGNSLSIFVKVDADTIRKRLIKRKTETNESLKERLERYQQEIRFEKKFDYTILNVDLDRAKEDAEALVRKFIYEDDD
jgi:guanylate kinase